MSRFRPFLVLFAGILLCVHLRLAAQTDLQGGRIDYTGKYLPKSPPRKAVPPKTPEAAKQSLLESLSVKKTGETTFKIGAVSLDSAARTVTIPAKVNIRDKMVEYALVQSTGKLHEAFLATEASAREIHLACLLLGVKPATDRLIKIDVSWKKHGPDARFPLQALLEVQGTSADGEKVLDSDFSKLGNWFYGGSDFNYYGFSADQEGSIISIIPDGAALAGHDGTMALKRDDIYFPKTSLTPVKDSPVSVHLIFP